MKKALTILLTALVLTVFPGCDSRVTVDETIHMVSSAAEPVLSRPEIQTVYGSETSMPDHLPESSEEESSEASSEQEEISKPEAQTSQKEEPEISSSSSQAPEEKEEPSHSPEETAPETAQTLQTTENEENVAQTQSVSSRPGNVIVVEQEPQPAEEPQPVYDAQPPQEEVRGVWISYLSMDSLAKNKTQAQFTANMDAAFQNIKDLGGNTVFVQVRPFGDALYPSEYFPWSYVLTGTEGQDPGYDPLEIMCQLAHQHGLRIEAWLNPYRIRAAAATGKPMSSDNPAWDLLESGGAIQWNGGIYYNPGSAEARKLILNGVKEIVTNYQVDGIHFDDYFYPTTDMSFDSDTYQVSNSSLSQADWRRENVNILVREVYAAIKAIDPNCVFGISPQGNTKNNYDGQFIDVAKWLANPGYVDYICPQIYFGFENTAYPFAQTVEKWNQMIKVPSIKLYVGIAAYKVGAQDQWAGAGKDEWLNTDDILARMVETSREASHYGGVALYSYDSLFVNPSSQMRQEVENLKEIF